MKPWLVPRRPTGQKSFTEPPFWATDALRYPFYAASTAGQERIENDFEGYVSGAYKSNGIVFACIDRRQQVFSQARFQWRRYSGGQPGELFGTAELTLLEEPWPNGTTGELLSHMESDASLAGNFYCTTVDERGRVGRLATGSGRRIARMRPDWTTLVIDAPSENPYSIDARVVAFLYEPRVAGPRPEPLTLLPGEVCHFSPKPDPVARFRGMSWLTPVISEVLADKSAMRHKLKFFDNGAQPNFAIKFDKDVAPDAFNDFVTKFNATHRGSANAYKTLFLANGADPVPLSMNFHEMDFKVTQAAGETRLSVASGVPATILGISEGLQGSSLNTGNFSATKRLFVQTTVQDSWNKAAPSLQNLVTPPSDGIKLEADTRGIPFLQEDGKDDAEIRNYQAQTLRQLIDAGWNPDAAVEYLRTGDLARLTGQHSGLYSVQLRPPGTTGPLDMPTLGETNGSSNGSQVVLTR